eukprot:GFKZ01001532.1.p1 GENE.GFKZ01001532.1~~GFKZ01001532.1.p1  ORF type:complete len:1197 (-),score=184.14 GFKZ01001532.1:740-4171(-)
MAAVTHPPSSHSASSLSPIISEMTVPITDILGGAKLEPLSPQQNLPPRQKPFPSLSLRPNPSLRALSNSRPSISPAYPSPSQSPPQHLLELIRPFCEPIEYLLPGGRLSPTLGPIVGQKRKVVSDLQSNLGGAFAKRRRAPDEYPTKLPKPVPLSRSQSPETASYKPSQTHRVSGAPVSPQRVTTPEGSTLNRIQPDFRNNTQHLARPDRVLDAPRPPSLSSSQSPKPIAAKSHPIRTSGAPVSPQRNPTTERPTFNRRQLDARNHNKYVRRPERPADAPRTSSLTGFRSPETAPVMPKPTSRMSGAPVSPRRDPSPARSFDNSKKRDAKQNARNVSSTERLAEGKRRRSEETDLQSSARGKRQRGSTRVDTGDMNEGVKAGTEDTMMVPEKNTEGRKDDCKERGQDKGAIRERRVRDDTVEDRENEKRKLDDRKSERNLPVLRSIPEAKSEKQGTRRFADKVSPVKGRENSDGMYKRSDRREHSVKRDDAKDKVRKRDVEMRGVDDKKSERKVPMLRSAPDTKSDKKDNRKSLDEKSPVKRREELGSISKHKDQKELPTRRDAPKLVSKPAPRSRKPEDGPANLKERSDVDSRPPKLLSKPLKLESKPLNRQTDTVKRESKPRKPDSKSVRDRSPPPGLRSSGDDGRPEFNRRKQDQQDRERDRELDKELDGDRERGYGRDRDRDRGLFRGSDRDRGKDRDRDRNRDSVHGRDGDRDVERERERDSDRERRRRGESRGEREDNRIRDKSRENDRERDRERERDRDHDRLRDRQRDTGRHYERERGRGRERDGDVEGDRGRWRDRDRRDRVWEQMRDGRNRGREAGGERSRAESDRGRDRERARERASRQSRSETDVKSGRTTREKDRKREKNMGDSRVERDGDRVSRKERDGEKGQGPSSRPSSGQGSVGSRNNPGVDDKQEGSGSKSLAVGNPGQRKMDLNSVRALLKELEKRCTEATKRCAQKLEKKEYDLYEEAVKKAFQLHFQWGLEMESELRLLEKLLPLTDRLVKKREIITHYKNLTRHFIPQHCDQLEGLKRKNGISYLMRGRNKVYLRMFGLQRMWERDQRVSDGEARKAAQEVIATRKGAGIVGSSSEQMPMDKLVRLKSMADDYGNLVSLLEGVLVDDGEGMEEAGNECKLQ